MDHETAMSEFKAGYWEAGGFGRISGGVNSD